MNPLDDGSWLRSLPGKCGHRRSTSDPDEPGAYRSRAGARGQDRAPHPPSGADCPARRADPSIGPDQHSRSLPVPESRVSYHISSSSSSRIQHAAPWNRGSGTGTHSGSGSPSCRWPCPSAMGKASLLESKLARNADDINGRTTAHAINHQPDPTAQAPVANAAAKAPTPRDLAASHTSLQSDRLLWTVSRFCIILRSPCLWHRIEIRA